MKHYIPDVPESVGVANVLRRARQMAEMRWTPICPFPGVISPRVPGGERTAKTFFAPWRPQTGANYSATPFDEKYLGINVSFETFMTALSNPDSVLYTRPLHGRAPLCAAFYGTVCSLFASYVMNMPFHIDCQQWPYLDGIEQIDPNPLENLKLCDILNERTTHTALITGIDRDFEGKIVCIAVTESTFPQVQSRTYTPKEFTEFWLKKGYEVLRYNKIDEIPYVPDPWNRLNDDPEMETPVPNQILMPDYGNKANYLMGEPVTISVFDPSYTEIEVVGTEMSKSRISVVDGKVTLNITNPGMYQAVAIKDGTVSEPVEFCIVEATVTIDKLEYTENEQIRVTRNCAAEDEPLGWIVKTAQSAKYWGYPRKEDGQIAEGTTLPQGEYKIVAIYRNAYGTYSSHFTPVFKVTKG